MPHAIKKQASFVHNINFLLDHHAALSHFPREFLEKFYHTLKTYIEKISAVSKKQPLLLEMEYLQAQLVESLLSLEEAKPYYFKVGTRGADTVHRKELVHLLEVIKSLSNKALS
jgi:thioredoxin-related protein